MAGCRSAGLGQRQPDVQDPGQCRDRRRRACRHPVPHHRRRGGLRSRSRRPGLIYLSYFMCNLGVLRRPDARAGRTRAPVQPRQLGHGHQYRRPHLGRPHDHQLLALDRPEPVRRLRQRPARTLANPFINTIVTVGRRGPGTVAAGLARSSRRSSSLILVVGRDLLPGAQRGQARRRRQSRPTRRPARRSSAEHRAIPSASTAARRAIAAPHHVREARDDAPMRRDR